MCVCVCVCVFIYLWLNGHSGPIPSHCRVFEIILRQNHPQHDPSGRAIICRTDLYLTTHSTHERQNILAPARFAPAVTTKRTTPDERLGLRGILQTYNATWCRIVKSGNEVIEASHFLRAQTDENQAQVYRAYYYSCPCILWILFQVKCCVFFT